MVTTLAGLDLAALLCSRVCHDLISPTGAIVNGLEVLEESKDEETREFALALIKKSATQATARLQFCRLAFGAAGSAGAEINLGDAETVARGFIEDDKIKLTWNLPRALAPKNQVKLLLNLLIVATQAIPRGGSGGRRRCGPRLPDPRQRNERPRAAKPNGCWQATVPIRTMRTRSSLLCRAAAAGCG